MLVYLKAIQLFCDLLPCLAREKLFAFQHRRIPLLKARKRADCRKLTEQPVSQAHVFREEVACACRQSHAAVRVCDRGFASSSSKNFTVDMQGWQCMLWSSRTSGGVGVNLALTLLSPTDRSFSFLHHAIGNCAQLLIDVKLHSAGVPARVP